MGQMQGEPVIEARGLNLTFQTGDGPVHALKDVNLTVNRGDFVSFIGPSGCGKTTFLRCIAALETHAGWHWCVRPEELIEQPAQQQPVVFPVGRRQGAEQAAGQQRKQGGCLRHGRAPCRDGLTL